MAGHACSRVGRARRRVTSRRRDGNERGSALVIALVVVIVIAVSGAAVLRQESSAPTVQRAYRTVRDAEVVADSAADAAIQKMRLDGTFGKDGGAGSCSDWTVWKYLGRYVDVVTGKTMYVQCQPQRGSGAPGGPTIPPDLWSYALFGVSEVWIHGETVTGSRRGRINGSIGVNRTASQPPPRLNEGAAQICERGNLTMAAGSVLVADSINTSTYPMSKTCTLTDVFTNQDSTASWSSLATFTTWKRPLSVPILDFSDARYPLPWPGHTYGVPGVPTSDNMGPCDPLKNITVPLGATVTLDPPGVYGAVVVKRGGTLKLKAGRYKFCNFFGNSNVVAHATLSTVAGTEIEIQGDMQLQGSWVMGPDDVQIFIEGKPPLVAPSPQTFYVGANAEVHGTFTVPWGQIHLGDGSNLYGHFWGDDVKGGQDMNLNQGVALPPSVLTSDRVAKVVTCDRPTIPCPSGHALLSALVSFQDMPRPGRKVKILSWVRNP